MCMCISYIPILYILELGDLRIINSRKREKAGESGEKREVRSEKREKNRDKDELFCHSWHVKLIF